MIHAISHTYCGYDISDFVSRDSAVHQVCLDKHLTYRQFEFRPYLQHSCMHIGGRKLHFRLHLKMLIYRHQGLKIDVAVMSPRSVVTVLSQTRHGVPPLPETRVAGIRHRSRLRSRHRSGHCIRHRSNNYH